MRFRGVSKTFGKTEALRDVSLDVGEGEFVALLGSSGCGKSTLLRITAGLETATAGVVEVDRTRVGFVFQEPALVPWRTARANVALPLELERVPRRERAERADDLLARVGLAGFEEARPHELSGGMRMRVSLARALVTWPKLLLLDEPFAALDDLTRQALDDLLRALWKASNTTVLFVTHSASEAAYLATRAVVLTPRPGRIARDVLIKLPAERDAQLRGRPEFAAAVAGLGGALAEAA